MKLFNSRIIRNGFAWFIWGFIYSSCYLFGSVMVLYINAKCFIENGLHNSIFTVSVGVFIWRFGAKLSGAECNFCLFIYHTLFPFRQYDQKDQIVKNHGSHSLFCIARQRLHLTKKPLFGRSLIWRSKDCLFLSRLSTIQRWFLKFVSTHLINRIVNRRKTHHKCLFDCRCSHTELKREWEV